MRIFHREQVVIAGVEFVRRGIVAVSVVIVEGRHILNVDLDYNRTRFLRIENIRFAEADELDVRFFDFVVIVRSVDVYLYYVLARDLAVVRHVNLDVERVRIARQRAADFGRAGFVAVHSGYLLSEVGVGQTVTEGILHLLIVPCVAGALFVLLHLVPHRLIEHVSEIDALLVLHFGKAGAGRIALRHGAVNFPVHGAVYVGIRIGFLVVYGSAVVVYRLHARAVVVPYDRRSEVLLESIDELARRIDFAAQYLSERHDAVLAGLRNPERGVHAVLFLIKLFKLHGVGRVENHDHLVEVGRNVFHELLFGIREFEIMFVLYAVDMFPRVRRLSDVGGNVGVLASHAGEHDYGRVVVRLIRIRDIPAELVNLVLGSRRRIRGVQALERGVDAEARSVQRVFERGRGVRPHAAGTRARKQQIVRAHAEHAYVTDIALERKHIPLVFKQNHAFACYLNVQILGRGDHVVVRSKIGIILSVVLERVGGREHDRAGHCDSEQQCDQNHRQLGCSCHFLLFLLL